MGEVNMLKDNKQNKIDLLDNGQSLDLIGDTELIEENSLSKYLDDEVIEYFNEARLIKKRTLKLQNNKKHFKVNDKVSYNNNVCNILYGPYLENNLKMFEIETIDGNIISVSINDIEEIP